MRTSSLILSILLLLPLSTSAARVTENMQPRSIREVRENANKLPSNAEGRKTNIRSALQQLNKENTKRDKFCEKGLCITLAEEWSYPKLERSFDTSNKRVIVSRQEDKDGNRASVAFTEFVIKKNSKPKDMMQFAMTLFTPNSNEVVLDEPKRIKAGTFDAYVSDYGSDETDRGRLVIVLTNPKKRLGHILLLRAYPSPYFDTLSDEFDQITKSIISSN